MNNISYTILRILMFYDLVNYVYPTCLIGVLKNSNIYINCRW